MARQDAVNLEFFQERFPNRINAPKRAFADWNQILALGSNQSEGRRVQARAAFRKSVYRSYRFVLWILLTPLRPIP